MRPCSVIVNDCAGPAVRGPISVRTHDTDLGERNFTLRIDEIAAGLPPLEPRHVDWLEILGFLFAIDIVCERGAGDVEWSRDIQAWFPVRDPDYWSGHAVAIQEIFTALTADRLQIRFEPASEPAPAPRQSQDPFVDHASVALLSGGVDSFVGAAEEVRASRRPLLLSHVGSGATNTAQSDVETVLRAWDPDVARVRLSAAKARGSSLPGPEPSQRSRTFMFVGAACLLAALGGSRRVLLNENGVMALHLPLTGARLGSLSTRTALPPVIARMEKLASSVFETEITVTNELAHLSKPDVVEAASNGGYAGELAKTVSCWSIGRTREHCGICPPCLMRRMSFETHGVVDVDYTLDALNDASVLDDERAQDQLAHFVSQVDDLLRLSDLELQFNYPELMNASPALSSAEAIDLHRRWAGQADAILSTASVPSSIR